MELPTDRIKKLQNALALGCPLKVALRHAGISPSTYYYWASLAAVAAFCAEQTELAKLSKNSDLAEARKRAYALACQDADGREMDPDPELVLRYTNSASFRKEADAVADVIAKCREAETRAIMKHLGRISKENPSKGEVDASKWYLERALPNEFGKAEPEKPASVQPVKVEFVKPSDDALERVRRIEEELAGERNKA